MTFAAGQWTTVSEPPEMTYDQDYMRFRSEPVLVVTSGGYLCVARLEQHPDFDCVEDGIPFVSTEDPPRWNEAGPDGREIFPSMWASISLPTGVPA